jgi:hypothetical protein
MRVSEHLSHVHKTEAAWREQDAEREDNFEKSSRTIAKLHRRLGKAADGDEHNKLAEEHEKRADMHKNRAESYRAGATFHRVSADACEKAAQDTLAKAGDRIIPDQVSSVIRTFPDLMAVPRTGQRPIEEADKANVPVEFEKLVSIDDE